ncbi:hypothetical protein AVEN_59346-1, partial [Araneus ventricosus]
VSWIRRRDFHVLTVGLDTYTTDDRFEAVHVEKNNDWTLKIKFAQLWDEGLYECQVSSDPKISLFVNLSIVGAKIGMMELEPAEVDGKWTMSCCKKDRFPRPWHWICCYFWNDAVDCSSCISCAPFLLPLINPLWRSVPGDDTPNFTRFSTVKLNNN